MNTTVTVESVKEPLIRTNVLVRESTEKALRELAEAAERPLAWEVRRALEDYVERQQQAGEAAA